MLEGLMTKWMQLDCVRNEKQEAGMTEENNKKMAKEETIRKLAEHKCSQCKLRRIMTKYEV